MNRVKRVIGLMAFSLMILSLPAIASAQWGGNGRYGGYGNNGQYGDMRSTVRSLKQKSDRFLKQADRELDRSRWDGTNREENFMSVVRNFENAVDDLNNSRNQNANEVQRVLNLGSQIDRQMSRMRVSGNLTQMWSSIEYDLRVLGNEYGYNDRNRNRNRGRGNNMPNWWPF